ncbi:helix-turn-helix transcriptional regulator [Hasllibacter sp. MH4015]|uniref:ArsR/SmtB family transcription factor n=1 Tax=Hasllibacter sp. MH4015 TaxID=2854029 RepID=UPI001CD7B26F|nr:metalloregulator ArsR/SmtB family transcription factor [Hasllibacter sp. MH4015]
MIRSAPTADPTLDAVFHALADPTRRAILARLTAGEASVTDLAQPFAISQPAISKHLKVLENAGLIDRAVDRRRRPARLNATRLSAAVEWLITFRAHWDTRLDTLDDLLVELQSNPAERDPDD